MASPVTRRRFLEGSAGAAVTAAAAPAAFAKRPDGPNIILVIVDSLRADAVYEDWARTPNISALARRGVRFTHVFPEAMPTVPARNSILSGRRQFPFRGWYDRPGLIEAPGWEPLERPDLSFLGRLRRAGYWTSYVTDNPFLGFAPGYGRLRNSVNTFVRTGGQIGGHKKPSSVPHDIFRHWLYPANDGPKARSRVGLYLANSRPWEGIDKTFAGRVFSHAHPAAGGGGPAPSLRARRRHVRAARALDAAGPLPPPDTATGTALSRRCRCTAAHRAG